MSLAVLRIYSDKKVEEMGIPDPLGSTGLCNCTEVGALVLVVCSLTAKNANWMKICTFMERMRQAAA